MGIIKAIECALAPGASTHSLPQGKRLDPGLDPQREDLGQSHLNAVAGAVVHELGHRAGADRANVACSVAEGVENLLVGMENLLVAPHPDGERRQISGACTCLTLR